MVKPAITDLDITRGDTPTIKFTWSNKNSAGTVTSPTDLTGCRVTLDISIPDTSSQDVTSGGHNAGTLSYDTSVGGSTLVLTDPVNGIVVWNPSAVDTAKIPAGRVARYNLRVFDSSGKRRTYLTGRVNGHGSGS